MIGRSPRTRWYLRDTYEIRRTTLRSVGRLTPRMTHEIHQMVEREVGKVQYRRLQRVMAWLATMGAIRRDQDGWLLVPRISSDLSRVLDRVVGSTALISSLAREVQQHATRLQDQTRDRIVR